MKKFDEYPILAVTSDDESYPFGMRKMSNNSVIYYKGNISLINATKNIAVIGTRKISDRGRKLAYETGCILAKRKITLVNGLALGCDAEAIKGTLSESGKCIGDEGGDHRRGFSRKEDRGLSFERRDSFR